MNIDLLKRFCAPNDVRGFLNEPFVYGDFIVACDGVLLIAIPATEATASMPELPAKVCALIDNAYAASKADGAWRSADNIALSDVKCGDCGGAGSVTEITCDDCDGEGFIEHGRHEYECKTCGGNGKHIESGGDTPCAYCKGTGLHALPSDFSLTFNGSGHSASSVYVALLRKRLIGASLCADLIDGGVIAVRFDGGFGALMPMRGSRAA